MNADLSERQQQVYDAYQRLGSYRAVAKELGIDHGTVKVHLLKCSLRGHAPGLEAAPPVPGFHIDPKTTVHLRDGKVVQEWRRLSPDKDILEQMVAALEDRVAGKAPRWPAPPKATDSDLLLEIPIPDHHHGQYSWRDETGADYDCDLASALLVKGVHTVLADTPTVKKILLPIMGDYFHSDNRQGMTERAGNILDTDSRFARRIDTGIEALCRVIELACSRADFIEVLVLSGNHDWHSAQWVSRILSAYYRDNPRVTIRTNPRPQQFVQHGKVLLAYFHGHTSTIKRFATSIPADQPALWAATTYRYGRVAHWHQRAREEFPGLVVETLPTMAAPDAYATEAMYRSRRAITACLWSAKWGLRAYMERSVEEIMEARS